MKKMRTRIEVMKHLESTATEVSSKFMKPVEKNWQPAELLPTANDIDFFDKIKDLQARANELPYEFWAVLVGDMITEEALPTYESWLSCMDGVELESKAGWMEWIRKWTAEENRHGDILNRYLYISGMVNMRHVEISIQHLITNGMAIGTGSDPYRNFVYTSFQEIATNYSHKRTSLLAKKHDNPELAKICAVIASDEARHARAYMTFIEKIFEADTNEMMLAFEDMMRKKIVMPAHFLREINTEVGETFEHFSVVAQRLGVYTAFDYIEILEHLIDYWKIESLTGLEEDGEKAREYVLKLPKRLKRVTERMNPNPDLDYKFSWIDSSSVFKKS